MNLANRFSSFHCMTRAMVWISDFSTTPRKTRQNVVSYQFSNRQRHDEPRQQSSSCLNGSPLLLFSRLFSRGSHSHEDKVSETTYWTSPKMAYSWSPVESEKRQMNHSLSTSFCSQRNLDLPLSYSRHSIQASSHSPPSWVTPTVFRNCATPSRRSPDPAPTVNEPTDRP